MNRFVLRVVTELKSIHMNSEELLKNGLDELGLPYTEKDITAFLTLVSELKKWNRAYNLTSIRTDKEIIVKHIFDSLLYLNVIPADALKVADLGSGAGFPGIPLKIMRPGLDITLVEPSRKKASFCRHIIRTLELTGIGLLQIRAEDVSEELQKSFDAAVSRATFSITDFMQAACPFIKDNGVLVISKGPKFSDELKGSAQAQEMIKEVMGAELPYEGGSRNLIVMKCM